MTTGEIIALCALAVSALVMLLGARRDTRGSAADQAAMENKLDSIKTGVDEIRIDQRAMRDNVDNLAKQVIRLEGRMDAAERDIKYLKEENRRDDHGI